MILELIALRTMNIRLLEQDNFTTLDTRNPILDILITALRFLPSICGFFYENRRFATSH